MEVKQKKKAGKRVVTDTSQQQQVFKVKEEYKIGPSTKELRASPEGAFPKDICSFVEGCKNESCKLYHPKWAVSFCLKYNQGKCNGCKRAHLDWDDLLALAEPDE